MNATTCYSRSVTSNGPACANTGAATTEGALRLQLELTTADGYCQCGCGQKTSISTRHNPRLGHVKGVPVRYLPGHVNRKSLRYLEQDRGYESPCWIWQLTINSWGYGMESCGGKTVSAHRAYYERAKGPIPEGLEIDHLCRVPACVNPAHLEAVTHAENMRRSDAPSGKRSRQTHCLRGHELAGANVRITPRGNRQCRVCVRIVRNQQPIGSKR